MEVSASGLSDAVSCLTVRLAEGRRGAEVIGGGGGEAPDCGALDGPADAEPLVGGRLGGGDGAEALVGGRLGGGDCAEPLVGGRLGGEGLGADLDLESCRVVAGWGGRGRSRKGFTPGRLGGGGPNGFCTRRDGSTWKGGIGPADGSVSVGDWLRSLLRRFTRGATVRQRCWRLA